MPPSHRTANPRQHWRSRRTKKGESNVWPSMSGGVEEDRTPDLRIANAALSQLSYHPVEVRILALFRPGDNAPVVAGAAGAL